MVQHKAKFTTQGREGSETLRKGNEDNRQEKGYQGAGPREGPASPDVVRVAQGLLLPGCHTASSLVSPPRAPFRPYPVPIPFPSPSGCMETERHPTESSTQHAQGHRGGQARSTGTRDSVAGPRAPYLLHMLQCSMSLCNSGPERFPQKGHKLSCCW